MDDRYHPDWAAMDADLYRPEEEPVEETLLDALENFIGLVEQELVNLKAKIAHEREVQRADVRAGCVMCGVKLDPDDEKTCECCGVIWCEGCHAEFQQARAEGTA